MIYGSCESSRWAVRARSRGQLHATLGARSLSLPMSSLPFSLGRPSAPERGRADLCACASQRHALPAGAARATVVVVLHSGGPQEQQQRAPQKAHSAGRTLEWPPQTAEGALSSPDQQLAAGWARHLAARAGN